MEGDMSIEMRVKEETEEVTKTAVLLKQNSEKTNTTAEKLIVMTSNQCDISTSGEELNQNSSFEELLDINDATDILNSTLEGDTPRNLPTHSTFESSVVIELREQINNLTSQLSTAHEEIANLNMEVQELKKIIESQQRKTKVFKKNLTEDPAYKPTPIKSNSHKKTSKNRRRNSASPKEKLPLTQPQPDVTTQPLLTSKEPLLLTKETPSLDGHDTSHLGLPKTTSPGAASDSTINTERISETTRITIQGDPKLDPPNDALSGLHHTDEIISANHERTNSPVFVEVELEYEGVREEVPIKEEPCDSADYGTDSLYTGRLVEGELLLEPAGPAGAHAEEPSEARPTNTTGALMLVLDPLTMHVHPERVQPQEDAAGLVMKKPKRLHTCEICTKKFTDSTKLKLHMRSHTGEKPFPCTYCPKRFIKAGDQRRHERQHTGEKPYVCIVCQKAFSESTTLRRHERIVHSGENLKQTKSNQKGPFNCKVCNKQFTYACDLKRHERYHTGEKPHPCQYCKKRFSEPAHLKRHERQHTGELPPNHGSAASLKKRTCNICGRVFSQSHILRAHMRTHTGEKPFPCGMCDMRFAQHSNLRSHERTHTRERPYICNECNKPFSQHSTLKRHERTHRDEKPYSCDICNKRFTQGSSRKKHMMIHAGEKPYSCSICKKAFRSSSTMRKHKQTHAEETSD